jgi:hypothetical protein
MHPDDIPSECHFPHNELMDNLINLHLPEYEKEKDGG